MKFLRTTWLLWKLTRKLHHTTSGIESRAVEFRVIVEPAASYERRRKLAEAIGDKIPPREYLHEVSWWPTQGLPCHTQRGVTLADALKRALDAPFPAPLG